MGDRWETDSAEMTESTESSSDVILELNPIIETKPDG